MLLLLAAIDEATLIWHIDLGQTFAVEYLVLIDNAIEIKPSRFNNDNWLPYFGFLG